MSEPIALPDADATREYGRRLGAALRSQPAHPVLIGLSGELGAGKTSLVGGVLEASGVSSSVRSPTYTLVEPYELKAPTRTLYHLDLYRLRSPMELEELGVRELLSGNNVLIVEWIENAPALAGASDLHLRLQYHSPGRRLSIEARTEIGATLRRLLLERIVTLLRS